MPLPALTRFRSRRSAPAAVLALAAALPGIPAGALAQNAPSLFGMGEVQADRFILVAAPIGSGSRSQLNIYEQLQPAATLLLCGAGPARCGQPAVGQL